MQTARTHRPGHRRRRSQQGDATDPNTRVGPAMLQAPREGAPKKGPKDARHHRQAAKDQARLAHGDGEFAL